MSRIIQVCLAQLITYSLAFEPGFKVPQDGGTKMVDFLVADVPGQEAGRRLHSKVEAVAERWMQNHLGCSADHYTRLMRLYFPESYYRGVTDEWLSDNIVTPLTIEQSKPRDDYFENQSDDDEHSYNPTRPPQLTAAKYDYVPAGPRGSRCKEMIDGYIGVTFDECNSRCDTKGWARFSYAPNSSICGCCPASHTLENDHANNFRVYETMDTVEKYLAVGIGGKYCQNNHWIKYDQMPSICAFACQREAGARYMTYSNKSKMCVCCKDLDFWIDDDDNEFRTFQFL